MAGSLAGLRRRRALLVTVMFASWTGVTGQQDPIGLIPCRHACLAGFPKDAIPPSVQEQDRLILPALLCGCARGGAGHAGAGGMAGAAAPENPAHAVLVPPGMSDVAIL